MTQIMTSQNGSSARMTNWGYQNTGFFEPQPQVATNPINVPTFRVEEARPKKDEALEIEDLVAIFESEPKGREDMASARQWLGTTLDITEIGTLKALRLAAGLSQASLAQIVGQQQPNISAIEAGQRKPEYETAKKIASALGLANTDEFYAAFMKSKKD
jgi:DNA-binding XRE family transcriptional regulator